MTKFIDITDYLKNPTPSEELVQEIASNLGSSVLSKYYYDSIDNKDEFISDCISYLKGISYTDNRNHELSAALFLANANDLEDMVSFLIEEIEWL